MSSRSTLSSSHLTRRSLLKSGVGGAVGLGFAASAVPMLRGPDTPVGAAGPTAPALPPAAPPGAMPPLTPGAAPKTVTPSPAPSVPTAWQAYHNVTGDTHQAKFDSLSMQGYRMISISISGDPNDPRYAAVWIQRPGPAFIGMHGVTIEEFDDTRLNLNSHGWAATLISATGLAGYTRAASNGPYVSNARYAAVLEQFAPGQYGGIEYDKPYLPDTDPSSFANQFKSVRDEGLLVPRSFAINGGFPPGNAGGLGVPAERRWAATFQLANPASTPWIFTTYVVDANAYQQAFTDLGQRGYRPAALAVTFDNQYAAVFVTAPAVGNWIGRHNMTADQYQQAFNDATAQGLIPLTVQAGGTGDDTRYAAVFAQLVP